jgi:hypothetical protein
LLDKYGIIFPTNLLQTTAPEFPTSSGNFRPSIKDPKSCLDFLITAKSLADQLVAVGKGVDDKDLISYVVGGVNSSYHPFITTLSFVT